MLQSSYRSTNAVLAFGGIPKIYLVARYTCLSRRRSSTREGRRAMQVIRCSVSPLNQLERLEDKVSSSICRARCAHGGLRCLEWKCQ